MTSQEFFQQYFEALRQAMADAAVLRDAGASATLESLTAWRHRVSPALVRLVNEAIRNAEALLQGRLTLPEMSDPAKLRAEVIAAAAVRHQDKLAFAHALQTHCALIERLATFVVAEPPPPCSLPALINAVVRRTPRATEPNPDTRPSIAQRDVNEHLRVIDLIFHKINSAAIKEGGQTSHWVTRITPLMKLARWAFARWVTPPTTRARRPLSPNGSVQDRLEGIIHVGCELCGLEGSWSKPPSAAEVITVLDRLETVALGGLARLGTGHGLLGSSPHAVDPVWEAVAESKRKEPGTTRQDALIRPRWEQVLLQLRAVRDGLLDEGGPATLLAGLTKDEVLKGITLALRLGLDLCSPIPPTPDHIKQWQAAGVATLQALCDLWGVDPSPAPDGLDLLDLSDVGWQELIQSLDLEQAPADPLAWLLFNLHWLGREIEDGERAPWRDRSFVVDPLRDREALRCWDALSGRRTFTADLLPSLNPEGDDQSAEGKKRKDGVIKWLFWRTPARRIVLSHLSHVQRRASFSPSGAWSAGSGPSRARTLARGVQLGRGVGQAMKELEEFFPELILGDSSGAPAWAEIAARALEELGEDGPVTAMASSLKLVHWERLVQYAERVPQHRATLAQARALWAEVDTKEAAPLSPRWFEEDSSRLEQLMDVVVINAALRRWSELARPALRPAILSMRHQRRRARGRLRALVFGEDMRLVLPALHTAAGQHARLGRALGWYLLRWVEHEVAAGLPITHHIITPPCSIPAEPQAQPDGSLRMIEDRPTFEALRFFVLVCALRGVYETMLAWAQPEGGRLNKGTLGALIEALPWRLADQESIDRGEVLAQLPDARQDPLELSRRLLAETARRALGSKDEATRGRGHKMSQLLKEPRMLCDWLTNTQIMKLKTLELPDRDYSSFRELEESLLSVRDDDDVEQAERTYQAMMRDLMTLFLTFTSLNLAKPRTQPGRVASSRGSYRTWRRLRNTLHKHHERVLPELRPVLEQIVLLPSCIADKRARAQALEVLVRPLAPRPPLAFGDKLLPPSKVDCMIQRASDLLHLIKSRGL